MCANLVVAVLLPNYKLNFSLEYFIYSSFFFLVYEKGVQVSKKCCFTKLIY